jgi:hypothetical protein
VTAALAWAEDTTEQGFMAFAGERNGADGSLVSFVALVVNSPESSTTKATKDTKKKGKGHDRAGN